jgi:hypothetical protein
LKSRARDFICSSERYLEDYFFFFLPVFFAFFAVFAFLAMLPSSPKLVQCKSSIDVQMIAYTTIAKLILRASNKVNGARPCE